jgi:hypothetical protein
MVKFVFQFERNFDEVIIIINVQQKDKGKQSDTD